MLKNGMQVLSTGIGTDWENAEPEGTRARFDRLYVRISLVNDDK